MSNARAFMAPRACPARVSPRGDKRPQGLPAGRWQNGQVHEEPIDTRKAAGRMVLSCSRPFSHRKGAAGRGW
jgi:hypothetical protein